MAVDASDSQAIQEKTHAQEDFDNDFQPSIKPAFSFVPSSDPFEGFKKKSGKEKSPVNSKKAVKASRNRRKEEVSHTTAVSTPSGTTIAPPTSATTAFASAIIKANLNNTCKDTTMILKIQKLVSHTAQVIYTGFMFADYFYPYQVKNKQVPATITHSLVYQLFSLFTGQGKKADEEAKNCFDRFCESLPERTNLDEFRGQGYQASASFMAKQYEALVGT
ncbi:hypothetical protein G6F55_005105 [Rhizopus delemar]|uniref:Uncharacterized protein n=2 Tax=Rhizopus TaxID=4842 RepID=A0A9P6ZC97_9FUNG|nr:hypothetical protein G6F55_005105 [Rhizopus delemar]KAG1543381.1 hypothetical protein G6F51_006709 [Rhizopus arrhizus]KAG1498797.1 hypothetical protein G6F54_004830 [Rhizopus delemar]KAG1517138.1 hypothetical protein G6F53_001614 [Rhizopus delemar]KAG1526417.1 hypothetical protein G6F52_002449 [Rhizopus delemar]